MPLTGSCSCEDWHNSLRLWDVLSTLAGSEMEGYNPLSKFGSPSDRHPDPTKPAKSFEVLPLQEVLMQHFLHLLQKGHKTTE